MGTDANSLQTKNTVNFELSSREDNELFANISSSVRLNHVSDPPNWERIAYYVDYKLPSGVSYCIPLSLKILLELASSSYLLARLLGWTTLVAIF